MDEHTYKRAMADPKSVFGTPEAVLHAKLERAAKKSLLERWKQSLPPDREPDLLTRIGRALSDLDTETGRHRDIESQGLYGSIDDNDPACRRD